MENYQNKCFISKIVKALSLKKKSKLYTLEKKSAGNKNQNDNICLCPKYSKYYNPGFSSKNSGHQRNGILDRFFVEDSMENFILKSAFGFIGGILLTYICFMFLVFSLNFTLKRATYICIGLGIILSLGLAFSVKIRCTVFLCIPQLFSKRGRQALLAYAFILALSGPAKNTLHNVEVMSESLACGQEQLKQAENEVLKCVQKPNAAARKSIEKLLEKINSAVQYFKNFIFQLYRNSFDILETVLHGQKWLYSISSLCLKKTCRPTQRCLNFLYEAGENCKEVKAFKDCKILCKMEPCVKESICFTNSNTFCTEDDVPAYFPVIKLQKQLVGFKNRATNTYSVKIEAHQTYHQYNRTNIYHEEYQGMATEIRQKTDKFLQYFDCMSVIFGIFILVLFVKVIIYRHKFLTEDQYDNRFITSDFVDIDNARAEFQMETLLPLAQREKMKYIKVTSLRLVPCEKVRLLSSFVFLIFATFKIIIHMLTDSSLYWILSSVRQNERLLYMSTVRVKNPIISLKITGKGLVADFVRNLTSVIERHSTTTPLDPTPCLPDPVPPDWNRYYQILALVLICWLLALCEPYGLRLRHSVMVTYHPERARERAIWLYNKILSNRVCFVKVARKELRKKYKDNPEDVGCSFQFLSIQPSLKCLLCNVKLVQKGKYFKCQTFNCVGMFCSPCFQSLKFCSICHVWGDSGDTSELSEERDSSDEDFCRCSKPKPKKPTPCSASQHRSFPLELKKFTFKFKSEFLYSRLIRKSPQNSEQKQETRSKGDPCSKKGKVPCKSPVTSKAQDPASPQTRPKSPDLAQQRLEDPTPSRTRALGPPPSQWRLVGPTAPQQRLVGPTPPEQRPLVLFPPQQRPVDTTSEATTPFKPGPNTIQVSPVQVEVFNMRKTERNFSESSDWDDDSDFDTSFYFCSNTSLETTHSLKNRAVDERRKNYKNEFVDLKPKGRGAEAEEDQGTLLVFQKISEDVLQVKKEQKFAVGQTFTNEGRETSPSEMKNLYGEGQTYTNQGRETSPSGRKHSHEEGRTHTNQGRETSPSRRKHSHEEGRTYTNQGRETSPSGRKHSHEEGRTYTNQGRETSQSGWKHSYGEERTFANEEGETSQSGRKDSYGEGRIFTNENGEIWETGRKNFFPNEQFFANEGGESSQTRRKHSFEEGQIFTNEEGEIWESGRKNSFPEERIFINEEMETSQTGRKSEFEEERIFTNEEGEIWEDEAAEKRTHPKKHLTWANPPIRYSSLSENEEKPKPDFLFKEGYNVFVKNDSSDLISDPRRIRHKTSHLNFSYTDIPKKFNLNIKDRKTLNKYEEKELRIDLEEVEEKKTDFENEEENYGENESKKKEIFAGFWVINSDKQERDAFKALSYGVSSFSDSSVVDLSREQGLSSSSRSTHRSARFPFIDPLSICQLSPRSRILIPRHRKDEKFFGARTHGRKPRLCTKNLNTSGKKMWSRRDDDTSSEEGEGQFYSQPYISHESKSESSIRTNSDLKRTSANLTVKIAEKICPKYYCEDMGSSKVKSIRRGKKTGANWSARKASPPSSSSSWEERISDRGVREVRRKPSKSRTEGHSPCKKSSQLSWAPDLLSDLPSSKPNNSDTSSD